MSMPGTGCFVAIHDLKPGREADYENWHTHEHMIERLAKSERVRQSIIRHAFRYFMGRNETLSDSKTLIDAEQAYVKDGGSFDAVIISLLTSDSFIYRTPMKADTKKRTSTRTTNTKGGNP